MTRKLGDQGLDILERRFQALRDQIGAASEACQHELEGALQELSLAIAALRKDRKAGESPGPDPHDRPAAPSSPCEAMLRHVFSAIPDLLTVHDRDFNTILSNWHGYESVPEAERLGRPKCYQVYHRRDLPCVDCHALEVLATGQPVKVEKVSPVDGRVREISAYPIRDEPGQVSLVVEHVRDITERRLAEQALKESEGRFRTLIEDSPESLFLTDVQGTILAASRVAARRLGKDLEDLIGALSFDQFPPEVAAHRRPFFDQAVATGLPVRIEDARGDMHFDINFNPILDADGKVSRLSILALDITDRKKAEQALKDREATLRTLIDASSETLILLDTRGVVLAASQVAAQRLGKSLEEIIGADLVSIIPTEVGKRRAEFLQEVVATGQPVRFEDVRGDFFFDNSVTPIFDQGQVVQVAILGVDISLRKQAEAAVQDSEARFRAIFATVQDTIFIKDRSFRYAQVNPAMERLFGRPAAEIVGKTDLELVGEAAAENIRKQDLMVLNGNVVRGVHALSVQGVPITFHYIKAPLHDEAGEIVGICGIARDITDLKQAEAALKESEERFRMLFEHVPDAYILADMMGEIIDCNQATEDLAGYGREELVGNNFACLPWLDFRQQVRLADLLAQTARGEVMGPVDFTLTRKDGGKVIAEGMSLPLSIQGQNLVLTIVRDVTARKLAEAELIKKHAELQESAQWLEQSRNMLQLIIESIPARVFWKDRDLRYLGCNTPFALDAGFKHPQELLGRDDFSMGWREQADRYRTDDLQVMESRCPKLNIVEPQTTPVGAKIWLSTNKVPLQMPNGEVFGVLGVYEDVTERQQAAEALRESEARFRHISSTISDISYSCSTRPDGSYAIDWLAGAVERITGYSVEEIQAQGCWKFLVIEADQPRFGKHITGLAAGFSGACELRLRHKNGGIVWVASFAKIVQEPEQFELLHIYGGLVDITARKQAEAELQQSEHRFRLMAETIQDVFWIATRRIGKTVYVSPGFEYIWGRASEALYRHPKLYLETVHPEDRERVRTEISAARKQSVPWTHEYRIIRPDGTVRWIQNRGFPVRDDQGRVILFTGVATDITEHKALEQQLLQAQKMEAVGRLAGGVAHDFNNLLMAITGYGELMRDKILRDDPLYSHLENILKAGDRAAALTQQLLTFSRQKIVHPEVIDLNRVVLELEPMLRRLIGEDIDLEVVTHRRPGAVKADPGQMGQIIMNLVVNARDAMPQGGRLTLKTAAVDFTEGCNTRFGLAPPGAYVMLVVQDTGVGMDEATQAHVFEPFFTTKEQGKGTGLGLSTVYGIVKQSGGYLDLESSPGAGSTFTIYLPRLDAIVAAPKAKIPITASFRGEDTILLVEDEDVLRGLLAKFLRLYGYTVLEARHGGEALLTCERHPGPIHLMVTDVVMPQMSGRELADRLTPLRPEMKIFYMSGYTEDALVRHGVADLSVAFLQKPFKPIELARRVHAVLHPPVTQ
jgi:two-component system, cell cycle sensor histidine kinase and response regulator CckA